MTTNDWAFVAGFWQGEGTIYSSIQKGSSRLYVVITQTDKASISWLKNNIKAGYTGAFNNPSHLGKKRVYQWKLYGLTAIKFIKKIYPFITSKYRQQQIKRVLAFDNKHTNHTYRNHFTRHKWLWD